MKEVALSILNINWQLHYGIKGFCFAFVLIVAFSPPFKLALNNSI